MLRNGSSLYGSDCPDIQQQVKGECIHCFPTCFFKGTCEKWPTFIHLGRTLEVKLEKFSSQLKHFPALDRDLLGLVFPINQHISSTQYLHRPPSQQWINILTFILITSIDSGLGRRVDEGNLVSMIKMQKLSSLF